MEVRGGIAIHASRIWDFVRAAQTAEISCFGVTLSEYGSEIKGSKLLEKKRFEWAAQESELDTASRHNGVKRFLTKSKQKLAPSKRDFTAFGQASLLMAHTILELLSEQNAVLFASMIPRGAREPKDYKYQHYLRKDLVFLQQRFFWFLEAKQEQGLFVLDQTEKEQDRRYMKRVQDYYEKTEPGRKRTKWIVPYPLFVDSDLSSLVQAADLCLYCLNWGYRRTEWKFTGAKRPEIVTDYAGMCRNLQFEGDGVENGATIRLYGIIYVAEPFTASTKNEKGGKAPRNHPH